MPYTRISNTRDGKAAIRYVMHKKGHNGNDKRNEMVTGINLLPDAIIPYSVQMDKNWQHASSRNHVRIHRIVQSFSREELDPDDEHNIQIAHEIGVRTAKKLYGADCQCIVATQADGKGHLIHNHILVSNVTLYGEGLINERTFHPTIRKITDEISAQFIDIPVPEPAPEIITPGLRGMRINNDENESDNISPKYIWQDDLRKRIRAAAEEAEEMDDFFVQLQNRGVKGIAKKATKTQPEYILYELIDTSGFNRLESVPKNLKSKSYKMGTDYQPDGIMETIRQHQSEKGDDIMSNTDIMSGLTPVMNLSEINNREEAANAEDNWSATVRNVFGEYKGWGSELPTEEDEVFGYSIDPDLLMTRARENDDFELRFKLYQNELRRKGVEIPPVFHTDKYSSAFLDREELRRQVQEFINKEYEPKNNGTGQKQGNNGSSPASKNGSGRSQLGRKDMKWKSKCILSEQDREERNRRAAEIFAKSEEIEKKAQERSDDYGLEF